MKRVALTLLVALAAGCATRRAPVTTPARPLMTLPVCSMHTGEVWLPDPCRMEVARGEWMRVEPARPEAKKRSRLWWLLLLLL